MTMLTEEKRMFWQPRIDYILDEFDFEKVRKVMTELDWQWQSEGVPLISQLRARARYLLWDAIEKDCNVSTGGLSVRWEDDDIRLSFVVEGMSSEYFEDDKEREI